VAELLTTINELPVADIVCRDRLRPTSEAGVAALLASIGELGVIKDAIHVRKKKDGSFHLMAGGHRLEAAKRLGMATIPVKVWTCTDDWARLMEIDDNLAGAELTPLDTALFLAARKQVYERLHPETARGRAGANARWSDASELGSFASTTAEKLGISERQVQKIVAAGERLDPRDTQLLRRAPRPVTLKDLAEIAKTTSAPERYHVVGELSSGNAKTAAEARRSWPGKTGGSIAPKDPIEDSFKALRTAWKRASKAARRRFLESEMSSVEGLISEIRGGNGE
jgi:ParB family chromosome partitioning protein